MDFVAQLVQQMATNANRVQEASAKLATAKASLCEKVGAGWSSTDVEDALRTMFLEEGGIDPQELASHARRSHPCPLLTCALVAGHCNCYGRKSR